MQRYVYEVRLKISDAQRSLLEKYATAHGLSKAAAVRHAMDRQLRYWEWQRKTRKNNGSDGDLDRLAEAILRQHPEYSQDRLWHEVAKRMGRFVDMVRAKQAAIRAKERMDLLGQVGAT